MLLLALKINVSEFRLILLDHITYVDNYKMYKTHLEMKPCVFATTFLLFLVWVKHKRYHHLRYMISTNYSGFVRF